MKPSSYSKPSGPVPKPHTEGHPLSVREAQVVRLLSLGCSVAQTAAILRLSDSTVANHKNRAMQKLGISKASLLTRAAIKFGISELDDELTLAEMLRLARSRLS